MILCREAIAYFENLMKDGFQIWNDACDFGVLVSDKELDTARDAMRQFRDEGADYQVHRYGINETCIEVDVPIEIDNNILWGYRIMSSYSFCKNVQPNHSYLAAKSIKNGKRHLLTYHCTRRPLEIKD